MKKIVQLFLLLNLGLTAGDEGILPRQLIVDLPKSCQVLMLHVTPDRKAKQIMTHASNGDRVENMGCVREISQSKLDHMSDVRRYYVSWKYPVWCRIAVGEKEGWVLQSNLKNEFYPEDDDDI
jgi:hypothetical protein